MTGLKQILYFRHYKHIPRLQTYLDKNRSNNVTRRLTLEKWQQTSSANIFCIGGCRPAQTGSPLSLRRFKIMKNKVMAAVLGGAFAIVMAGDAFAWSRKSSVSGANGSASVDANAGCSGGTCSRNIQRTGPNGNSSSRSGSASCSGNSCSTSSSTTTRSGNSVSRSGGVTW